MSSVKQALAKLEGAVAKLEGSVVKIEGAMVGQQRDMFGAPIKKKSNGNGLQTALFAKRLDQTIEKIEDILGEA